MLWCQWSHCWIPHSSSERQSFLKGQSRLCRCSCFKHNFSWRKKNLYSVPCLRPLTILWSAPVKQPAFRWAWITSSHSGGTKMVIVPSRANGCRLEVQDADLWHRSFQLPDSSAEKLQNKTLSCSGAEWSKSPWMTWTLLLTSFCLDDLTVKRSLIEICSLLGKKTLFFHVKSCPWKFIHPAFPTRTKC